MIAIATGRPGGRDVAVTTQAPAGVFVALLARLQIEKAREKTDTETLRTRHFAPPPRLHLRGDSCPYAR